MAHKKSSVMTVKIDNASAALTEITASTNSASLRAAMELLEDSVLSDTAHNYISGMMNGTLPLNGWVNTTTDGIFGPLTEGTSITKTVSFYNGISYYTGEVWAEVEFSGGAGELQTWSANCTFDGLINRTSVAPA